MKIDSRKQFTIRDNRDEEIVWTRTRGVSLKEIIKQTWSITCIRWALSLTILSFSTVAVVFYAIEILTPRQISVILWAPFVLLIPAVILLLYLVFTNTINRGFISYYLSRSQCYACLADLRGQPIEDDGCVVCPECGAAWKITDKVAQP